MAGFTFSHQFYERWLNAPMAAKQAIIDELSDIIQLLDTDTDLHQFGFTHIDLNQYLDEVFDKEAATDIDSNKALPQQAPAAVDANVALESIADTKDKANFKRADKASLSPNPTQHDRKLDTNASDTLISNTLAATDHLAVDKQTNPTTQHAVALSIDEQHADQQQRMIDELERHIDDYLSEQILHLSEQLKAWARDEIERQTQHTAPPKP